MLALKHLFEKAPSSDEGTFNLKGSPVLSISSGRSFFEPLQIPDRFQTSGLLKGSFALNRAVVCLWTPTVHGNSGPYFRIRL